MRRCKRAGAYFLLMMIILVGQAANAIGDGDRTFTPPEISNHDSPENWAISLPESNNAEMDDYAYTANSVNSETGVIPKEFGLSQNSPNPFNLSTRIEFSLPIKSYVYLNIYNILGQEIKQLVGGDYAAGNYSAIWDGTNQNDQAVASGIYLYRLAANDRVIVKKMVILK
jgi:hypothetical protein